MPRRGLGLFLVILLGAPPVWADAPLIQTAAKNAIVIDQATGTVLYEKDPDARIPTASMSKVMTAYVVHDVMKQGKLKPDDMLPVSQKAWSTQGSKMFVELNNSIKVSDLLKGVIIQSGNDACIVLAEGIAGSEEHFADLMNQDAAKLGLKDSHFANATGLPDPNHYSTVRDLANLAVAYIRDFPEDYKLNAEKEFTYHGIKQGNRNPLLYTDVGADGVKTGHTDEAGFGVIGSAVQRGHRIVMVISGMVSMKERAEESDKLIRWAFREFSVAKIFKAGDTVASVPVWLGKDKEVPLVAGADASLLIARADQSKLKAVVKYNEPIAAPITKGTQVGTIEVSVPGKAPASFPIVAGADVAKAGPLARIGHAFSYLFMGQ